MSSSFEKTGPREIENIVELAPKVHTRIEQQPTVETWLPPDFDPDDPKWAETDYVESIVTVHDETVLGEGDLRALGQRIVEDFEVITRTLVPDYEPEKNPLQIENNFFVVPVAPELNPTVHEKVKLSDIKNRSQEVLAHLQETVDLLSSDLEFRQVEGQKMQERTQNTKKGGWFSGMMNKLGSWRLSRELQALAMAVAAMSMLRITKATYASPEVASPMPDSLAADTRSAPEYVSSDVGVETAAPGYEVSSVTERIVERPATLATYDLVINSAHSPKFKLNKGEAGQAALERAQLVDTLKGDLDAARESGKYKDLKIVAEQGNFGASLRRRFDQKKTAEQNRALGQKKFLDMAGNPLAFDMQSAFPDVPLEIKLQDYPSYTVDGQQYSPSEAEALVRRVTRTPDGAVGDRKLYELLKDWDNGKRDGVSADTARILEQLQEGSRNPTVHVTLEGMEITKITPPHTPRRGEDGETRRPRRGPEKAWPAGAKTSRPVPVQPEYSKEIVELADHDPAIVKEFSVDPANDEQPGERPRPRYAKDVGRTVKVRSEFEEVLPQTRYVTRKVVRTPVERPLPEPASTNVGEWSKHGVPMKSERKVRPAATSGKDSFSKVPHRDSGIGTYGRKGYGGGRGEPVLDEAGYAEPVIPKQPTASEHGYSGDSSKNKLTRERWVRQGKKKSK